MSQPPVSFRGATKVFGATDAVRDLTFDVSPGRVVGLLGRNGAGKTTSLRMLLGLAKPTAGEALVFGRRFADLADAARQVGVAMDGANALAGATGSQDLRIWARMLGLPRSRVDEVLAQVGLDGAGVADRAVGKYSTGMRKRHAMAVALLANPPLLVLDEPANGLDPDGIRWMRRLLRSLADAGHTVLLSSHLLAEVESVVDDVVIIATTVRYAGTLAELTNDGEHRLEERFFEVLDGGAGDAIKQGVS